MKFFSLLCFSLSLVLMSFLSCQPAFAEGMTETMMDGEAFRVISDAFTDSTSAGSKVAIGIVILSALMNLLKWERFGNLFDKIPKQYRSFVPATLGACIGLLQAMAIGSAGMGVLLLAFINGALFIGGLQQALYQQLKGTGIGDLIGKLTKV